MGIELSHVELKKARGGEGSCRKKATIRCDTTGLGGPNPLISEEPLMPAPLQLAWFPEAVTDTRKHLGCPLPLSDLLGLSSQAEGPEQ